MRKRVSLRAEKGNESTVMMRSVCCTTAFRSESNVACAREAAALDGSRRCRQCMSQRQQRRLHLRQKVDVWDGGGVVWPWGGGGEGLVRAGGRPDITKVHPTHPMSASQPQINQREA